MTWEGADFGSIFGNGLSYATSDGQTKADSPQIMERDLTLPSGTEMLLFSDRKCDDGDADDEACDYWRPETVAHRTWAPEPIARVLKFPVCLVNALTRS